MKYSFVIPTFNNKANLINSLEALVRLDYAKDAFEVIVVDDGSSDGLISSLCGFRDRLHLRTIRLEREERSCRSRARNYGWRQSRGVHVVFIDSDIIVKPDYLRQLDRYFAYDDSCLVIGTRIHASKKVCLREVADGSLFRKGKFDASDISSLDYRYAVFSSESFNGKVIADPWLHAYSCNIALSKRWLLASGGFDENFLEWGLEDVEFAYRLYCLGINIEVNPFLEVVHQGAAQRDDIAICADRMDGYINNIDRFVSLHPEALCHYRDPTAVLTIGHQYRDFAPKKSDFCVANFEKNCSANLIADLVKKSDPHAARIVLFDYADDSNLDVHVQKFRDVACPLLYYPMSKVVNVADMMQHINSVRSKTVSVT